jgi:hypothetical protein
MYINNNEPDGQIGTQAELGPTLEENERCFSFDELGFYSPGKPATATNGYSSADCGGALSTTELPATISPNTVYNLPIEIDGVSYTTVITTPASGSGSLGALTYGDLCEGINTGSWITGGDDISDLIYVYITDRSSGVYPTILNKQSYGFIIFQSLTTGSTSSVELICEALATNLFYQLSEEVCGNVNVNQYVGEDAGVANDALNPENERERLLTHLTFTPIVKTSDRVLIIDYTLTVSVSRTNDSSTNITNNT